MQIDTLKNLLQNISTISSKYKDIDKISGNRFNIFSILKMESKEVKLHSALIAELLNPKGIHDMDTVFLELFISELNKIESISPLHFFASKKTSVIIELHIGTKTDTEGGRVDIILKDESENYIIIENKIYAGDQENQLIRYNNIKAKHKCLLYLTLKGEDPSPLSCQGLEKYKDFHCISYKELISNWLVECHKMATSHPKVRETILQYSTTINQLTGKGNAKMEEKREFYNAVGNSINNALSAHELTNVWNDIKWFTEWDFWNELISHTKANKLPEFTPTFSAEKLNSAIHFKKNKDTWYGMYTLLETSNYNNIPISIYLIVQRGIENLYYGIIIEVENKDETYLNLRLKDSSNLFFEHCSTKLSDQIWSYKKYFNRKINFSSFEDEETIKLINPDFRKKVILDLIHELNEFIIEYRKDGIKLGEKTH